MASIKEREMVVGEEEEATTSSSSKMAPQKNDSGQRPSQRKKQKSAGLTLDPDRVHRLTVQLEFEGGSPNQADAFTPEHFRTLVDVSVRRVLGQAAPDYEVEALEPPSKKGKGGGGGNFRGAILVRGRGLHMIWAALSVSGVYFDQRVAFHFASIHAC